ncbi:MAG: hypothetical protein HQL22_06990, partial [Candidatus Omnitrophica bacterium]|nr:hypothetical protein [Candidatus Omnitrophota bacterium]
MASTIDQVKDVLIRSYSFSDRESVRAISLATAMTGKPSSDFFDGNDILADALTGYFTDHEPVSCFVAVVGGKVVGYIIGSLDTRQMDLCFLRKLLFPLAWKVIVSGSLFRWKNLRFLSQVVRAAFTGRLWAPDFAKEYP